MKKEKRKKASGYDSKACALGKIKVRTVATFARTGTRCPMGQLTQAKCKQKKMRRLHKKLGQVLMK